jgi:hypothetical protein
MSWLGYLGIVHPYYANLFDLARTAVMRSAEIAFEKISLIDSKYFSLNPL